MSYSRPAIEFQATLKAGDKFTPIKDYAAHAGRVLTVDTVKFSAANPDDYVYYVNTDEGDRVWVRCWWLRKCCRRVE